MPSQSNPADKNKGKGAEISVGPNECRLARQGEKLIARNVLSDVVVTVQVASLRLASMLRFSLPLEEKAASKRLDLVREFADGALSLLLQNLRSMNVPAGEIEIHAIGAADAPKNGSSRAKQLALTLQSSLKRCGIPVRGTDLGGGVARTVWVDSASGRLVVRSTSQAFLEKAGGQTQKDFPHLLAS